MSLPARPIKLSSRVRRNFVSRDWTSIGLRGARVTLGKARTRTKQGSAGSGLSNTHTEGSRIVGFDPPPASSPLTTSAPSEKDWSELLWLGLIVLAIVAAATVQVMQ
jgi:hypothetical protein